jgi:eukaryotic-like serine/threonine-protein kinase
VVSELQPGDPRAIGPYRLVGRLGQGGMGQVFLGVSPGGRPVAVKAIRAELASDPEFRARFGREVAAARRVSGVYTATVVDADVDGPVAWLATAYVAGPSLAEAVDGHGPLPEASLLALAAGLAESLSAIHAAGVVHRDLKPSNVLLAEDGPRVIDFGISRAAESSPLTRTGLVIGSPGFMSPEQATGAEVGPPSDIFSLGAVLAFAATGEGPFGTGTTATLLYRVVHETPHLDRVPAGVRPLVERCLVKDPARRPTGAGVLAAAGNLQPAGNWLPDSIIRAFPRNAPPATAVGPAPTARDPRFPPGAGAPAATTLDPQFPGPAGPPAPTALDPRYPRAADPQATATMGAGLAATAPLAYGGAHQPPPGAGGPGDGGDRPRRRLSRAMVLGLVIGGLVVIAAATAFAVTAGGGHSPSTARSTPATHAPASAHTATGAATSPAVTQSATGTSTATSSASTTPTATTSTSPTATTSSSASASQAPTTAPATAAASASATP